MTLKPLHLMTLPALLAVAGLAGADEHTEKALQHAKEVVESAGDSKAMAQHAAEALKHIEEAKATLKNDPEALKRLEQGEAELKAALDKANRYHGSTAVQNAKDAKEHLEAAHQ